MQEFSEIRGKINTLSNNLFAKFANETDELKKNEMLIDMTVLPVGVCQ